MGPSEKARRGEQVGNFLNCDGEKGKGCKIVKENIVIELGESKLKKAKITLFPVLY